MDGHSGALRPRPLKSSADVSVVGRLDAKGQNRDLLDPLEGAWTTIEDTDAVNDRQPSTTDR